VTRWTIRVGGRFTTNGDDLTNLFRGEGGWGTTPRVISQQLMESVAPSGFVIFGFQQS
jgi:hypothetical protein